MSGKKGCDEWACNRKAKLQNKRNGRFYCSEFCAKQDAKGGPVSIHMLSEATEQSGTQEHGDPLEESLKDEGGTLSETVEILKQRPQVLAADTESEMSTSKQKEENTTMQNSTETLSDSDFETMNEDTSLIPQKESDDSILNYGEALLASRNICDNSIKLMHGLLLDVADNVKMKRSGERQFIDPQLVNAACNVASQMASLMKMKLKHHKMAIKHHKG